LSSQVSWHWVQYVTRYPIPIYSDDVTIFGSDICWILKTVKIYYSTIQIIYMSRLNTRADNW
jgi:hypothetical protein